MITKMFWNTVTTIAIAVGAYRGIRQSIVEAQDAAAVGRAYSETVKESHP